MHFDVLGPLRVFGAGGRIVVPAGRASAAMCWLILNVNETVSAESFVPVLWADPPGSAVARARMVTRSLAPLLEPGTLLVDDRFGLVASDDAVDARRFERLVLEARRQLDSGPEQIAHVEANLREALGLWRGEACPELDRALPAQGHIDRLTDLRLGAQEELNALVLRGGVDYPGVADLRAQVILHPERPRLHRQLAIALYRTHRQVEALEVLRVQRSTAGANDPLATQLQDAILRHDAELAAGPHPAG